MLFWPALRQPDYGERFSIGSAKDHGPFRHPTHWQPLPTPPAIMDVGESAQSQPGSDGIEAAAGEHGASVDWVLVPREPTEEMCDALESTPVPSMADLDGTSLAIWRDSYAAMLAAAPKPQQSDGDA